MAQVPLDAVLVTERRKLELVARQRLQERLASYRAGIAIVAVRLQDVHPPLEVVGAFRRVASALEEKLAMVNQAEAYRNEQIPLAKGKAIAQIKSAEAYRVRRTLRAVGEAQRFLMLSEVYGQFPEVTRVRLYLEAIEQTLAGKPKVIMDARRVGRKQMLFVDEKGLSLGVAEAVQSLLQQQQQQTQTPMPPH
jgi:regulator of protease activity HflC (stomatin/prohibitin superfamily)